MRRLTISEFHAELKAQGVPNQTHCALKCPICGTVQSMADFVAAGDTSQEAERAIGFSCIGRRTAAGPHKRGAKPGKGCDWTLGGLFKIHDLEVIDGDGNAHPRFELATPEEAQAHAAKKSESATFGAQVAPFEHPDAPL